MYWHFEDMGEYYSLEVLTEDCEVFGSVLRKIPDISEKKARKILTRNLLRLLARE